MANLGAMMKDAAAGRGNGGSLFGGGWLGNLVNFENSFTKNLGHDIFSNPTRLITGVDPLSTGVWNKALGTNYKPMVGYFGSPGGQYYDKAEAEGVDTSSAHTLHTIADTIAGFYGAAGIAGIGGGAGSSLAGSGGIASAGSAGADVGLGSMSTAGLGLEDLGWASGLGGEAAVGGGAAGLGALGSAGAGGVGAASLDSSLAGIGGMEGMGGATTSLGTIAGGGGGEAAGAMAGGGSAAGGGMAMDFSSMGGAPNLPIGSMPAGSVTLPADGIGGSGIISQGVGGSSLPDWLKTGSDFLNSAGSLIGANRDRITNQQDQEYWDNMMNKMMGMYQPGTPEANLMQSQMEAKDAAAGRNSQYGVRATNLAGMLAQQRANIMTSPSFYNMGAASRGHYDNSLNSLFASMGQQNGGNNNNNGGGILNNLGTLFNTGSKLWDGGSKLLGMFG